jgi:Superinfection immunity protein
MPYFLATSSDAGASAGALVLLFLLFLFGCVVWIMPGVIASLRKHRNQGAIWALTILGGWTFIGWIIAFVWPFTSPPSTQPIVINNQR